MFRLKHCTGTGTGGAGEWLKNSRIRQGTGTSARKGTGTIPGLRLAMLLHPGIAELPCPFGVAPRVPQLYQLVAVFFCDVEQGIRVTLGRAYA